MGRMENRALAARSVTPSAHLRRLGHRSLIFGLIFAPLAVMYLLILLLPLPPVPEQNTVVVVSVGVLGILCLTHSVLALDAAPRFPEVAREAKLLKRVGIIAIVLGLGSWATLLLMAIVDVARRPLLADISLIPLGALVGYLFLHSSLRDALRYGPPGSRVMTPSEYLRNSGEAFGGAGLFLLVGAGVLWGHYALHRHTPEPHEVLFMALMGAFALVLVTQSVIAFRAVPQFPLVVGLARINDAVGVLAAVIGIGGTIALVILGVGASPFLGIVAAPILSLVNFWILRVFLRKAAAKVLALTHAQAEPHAPAQPQA